MPQKKPSVAIIMGSQSDLPVMEPIFHVLQNFRVDFHAEIVSAHRTPEHMFDFARSARKKGFKIIIAGAGGAAHLPGMVASLTSLPVIGVPIHSSNSILGLDSLFSIVQMPKGVPVATVAVNGAENAALLAIRMLGLENEAYWDQMEQFQEEKRKNVLQNRKINF